LGACLGPKAPRGGGTFAPDTPNHFFSAYISAFIVWQIRVFFIMTLTPHPNSLTKSPKRGTVSYTAWIQVCKRHKVSLMQIYSTFYVVYITLSDKPKIDMRVNISSIYEIKEKMN